MSRVRVEQGDLGELGQVDRRGAAGLAALVLVAALAASVAWLFAEPMQFGRFVAVLLAGTLLIAAALGLAYGVVAGGVALVAFHFAAKGPLLPDDLLSRDGLLLGLCISAAAVAALYAELARQRDSEAQALLAVGGRLSAHASDLAQGRFLRSAAAGGLGRGQGDALDGAARAFVSVVFLGAGWVAAGLVGSGFGPAAPQLVLAAAVLATGAALGARFGLVAGVLAAFSLIAFPVESGGGSEAPSAIAFQLLMFAGLGWGMGSLSDGLERERRSTRNLAAASRELSAGADERAIRAVLLETLAKITGGGRVEVHDETGAEPLVSSGPHRRGETLRQRDLLADGRNVGLARWTAGADERGGARDDAASAVIDLGASAIVRARLGVEKAEMEFVARTEHLRTILLDAVSHHFRSPLAGILGSATSILNLPEHHDGTARRELLLIIKEQANRLNRYVENFLSVARLESGAVDVRLGAVALEPLIYDVWETFGEAGGARRFLHVQVDETPVLADPALLAQVFGNILENAIKFSEEGSMVDVRSHGEGDRLIVEFTDQGCGVAPANEDRIFGRFFRSQGAPAPGLGLGLYITRSLVEMLGGSVDARNRTDAQRGLTVRVNLPMAEVGV